MDGLDQDATSRDSGTPLRKEYRQPTLRVFGSVGSLTNALFLKNGADGGGGKFSRTS